MKVLAVIGARLGSSRLPGKHLLDLAGKPLIARIFERLDKVPDITHAVLATTNEAGNRPLVAWAEAAGRDVFAYAGSVDDLVGRVDAVVQAHHPDVVVYVCGDSPLIHPPTISALVQHVRRHATSAMARVARLEGQAPIHEGFDVYSVHGWDTLVARAHEPHQREHVGISLAGEDVEVAYWRDDHAFYRMQHRLSVDTVSDYRFMCEVYQRHLPAGEGMIVDLARVVDDLAADENLRGLNAEVVQRTPESSPRKVLILTVAGNRTGLGHLRRTTALARALQDRHGMSVTMVIATDRNWDQDLLLITHHWVTSLWSFLEREPIDGYDAVVVDVPPGSLSETVESRLTGSGVSVLVSLDSCLGLETDLNWVPCFYMDRASSSKNDVFGWDCYLLEPCAHRQFWQPGSSLVILCGSADPFDFAGTLPSLLAEILPSGFAVHWVSGPFAVREPTCPNPSPYRLVVHKSPSHINPIIAKCSYALSLYGVSFFECLAHGLPTVVVTPENHVGSAEVQALDGEEVAVTAPDLGSAAVRLGQLIRDPVRSRRFHERSWGKIDGHGAARLADRVAGLLTKCRTG